MNIQTETQKQEGLSRGVGSSAKIDEKNKSAAGVTTQQHFWHAFPPAVTARVSPRSVDVEMHERPCRDAIVAVSNVCEFPLCEI